ncbi:MAG TPA: hypothetical protein VF247_06490 [Candidatus Krumholzibacteria bacterium]
MKKPALVTLLSILLCTDLADSAPSTLVRAPACPWKVAAIREPRAGELPYEEATHYLRPGQWEERNKVFGPGKLVAYVRTERRRGYLEIENFDTGEDSVFVLPGACLPAWSPDGRYLSVDLWTKETTGGMLRVLDVATWKGIVDVKLAQASDTKWSPDSRMIVGAGYSHTDTAIVLYSVTIPEGNVSVVDTTRVLGDIDFSWSPDSRWIVYSKPRSINHFDETMVSDLWIAEAATGAAWCLVKSTDHDQSDPLWITDRTLQVDRVWWTVDGDANWSTREDRVVIELTPSS